MGATLPLVPPIGPMSSGPAADASGKLSSPARSLLRRLNARHARVLALSLVLHGGLAWLILAAGPSVEHGAAGGLPQTVRVRILAPEAASATADSSDSLRPGHAVPETLAPRSAAEEVNQSRPANRNAEIARAPDADASNAGAPLHSVYFDQGRLTRLPSPLGEVTLDDDAITAVPVSATVQITLFVNADGAVADATARIDGASEGEVETFVARVLARLRDTRFHPGEIDGAPVPARLDIVVIGRPLAQPAS
ncbi:MAG: hypothetical protein ACTHKB_02435 [Burkholderiaceae bacterium]